MLPRGQQGRRYVCVFMGFNIFVTALCHVGPFQSAVYLTLVLVGDLLHLYVDNVHPVLGIMIRVYMILMDGGQCSLHYVFHVEWSVALCPGALCISVSR